MHGFKSDGRAEEMAGATIIGSSLLREVKVEEAVGLTLAHDLTQIIPGKFKGRLFRKGYRVKEADIPRLKDIGKEHLYVIQLSADDLHEDDAAQRMAAALSGEHTVCGQPHEGKVSIQSAVDGLAIIPREVVDAINALGEVALATIVSRRAVRKQETIAATRVIPLIVPKAKVQAVERIAHEYRGANGGRGPLSVKPFRPLKAGMLTTGNEVYEGRIADKFGPAVAAKLAAWGSELAEQRFAPDDRQIIVKEIRYLLSQGYDMILVSGGMSVDPDDRTPGAIAAAGAEVVSYGTPMLPGSMLLFGYLAGTPIFGLPGCVMHDPYTSFDVLLPRVLAGDKVTREEIVSLGYGGLHR